MSETEEPWKDENWLYEQYIVEERSMPDIAKDFDVNSGAIGYWLKKHDIETRSKSVARSNGDVKKLHDAEWLKEQYVDKEKTLPQIAEICNVSSSTVRSWMNNHGLETRKSTRELSRDYEKLKDESDLRNLYVSKGYTINEIAEEYGISYKVIRTWLIEFGIELRGVGQSAEMELEKLDSEEYLREKYVSEEWPINRIADECNASNWAVFQRLNYYGIETRSKGHSGETLPALSEALGGKGIEKLRDEEWLTKEYITNERSCNDIANELSVVGGTVAKYLRRKGIDVRDRSESIPTGSDHHNWKENASPVCGPNWEEQRLKARIRDQGRCQRCGIHDGKHLETANQVNHVHHIVPRSKYVTAGELDYEKANRLDNLVTLCASCHQQVEGLPLDVRA